MPKFSIILPVRNGGEYIKECVNSILSQTEQDFNLIILDNCSTDGTREWLTSLANEKIIIYPSDSPLTIEENWARITKVPKNEFITLTGHDDLFYPDFLKNIEALIKEAPGASIFHTHFDFIDAKGKIIRSSKQMPRFLSSVDLLKGFLDQSVDSMGTGYVMRAADYDRVGGIPVKYPNLLFADFELWLSLAEKGGIAIAEKKCFAFRVHKSTTGSSQDFKLHRALELYIDFLANQKRESEEKSLVISEYAPRLLLFYCKGFCNRMLRTGKKKRSGITVKTFILQTKKMAGRLGVENNYHPEKVTSIKIATLIDSSRVLSYLFLLGKRIYSKPVLK